MQKDITLRLPPHKAFDTDSLRKALGLKDSDSYVILRRSVDARRRDIMVDLLCRINPENPVAESIEMRDAEPSQGQVIVVGSGPAGLLPP